MLEFVKYLFQLVISPGNGWEDISAQGERGREVAVRGFSVTLIVVALSAFTTLIYSRDATFVGQLSQSIILYVLYWVTFYFADTMFSLFLKRMVTGAVNESRVKTYIAYSVSMLSLMSLVTNLLPFSFAIVQLFPVYVAIVMWKGAGYLGVFGDMIGKFMLLAIFSIILPPVLIGMMFEMIL